MGMRPGQAKGPWVGSSSGGGGGSGNLFWLPPIISIFNNTLALPVDPTTGDRYLAEVTANGWIADRIYEWNGSTWVATVPVTGMATYNKEDHLIYIFDCLPLEAVGWWKGEDNMFDSIGSNTLQNAGESFVMYDAGYSNRCFKIGGFVTASLTIDSTQYPITNRCAYEFYTKTISGSHDGEYISLYVYRGGIVLTIMLWPLTGNIVLDIDGVPDAQVYTASPYDSDWHKLRFLYDNFKWKLFIDNTLQNPDNGYVKAAPLNGVTAFTTAVSVYHPPYLMDEIKLYM
jgi:hypothetical protein